MKLDSSSQRLIIMALKTQIKTWRALSDSGKLTDEDEADLQNDIGGAYSLLGEMEASYFKEFGFHSDQGVVGVDPTRR